MVPPQRVIPWESRRFELGLALFLWSLHVISLILMRPHGPPVMCSGGTGDTALALRPRWWLNTSDPISSRPSPPQHTPSSLQPGLSGASNVLLSRFTGSHSSEEIQQAVNHQSVESALWLHDGASVYHTSPIDERLTHARTHAGC